MCATHPLSLEVRISYHLDFRLTHGARITHRWQVTPTQGACERLRSENHGAIARVDQVPCAHEARSRDSARDDRPRFDVSLCPPSREHRNTQIGSDHFQNGFGERHTQDAARRDARGAENVA